MKTRADSSSILSVSVGSKQVENAQLHVARQYIRNVATVKLWPFIVHPRYHSFTLHVRFKIWSKLVELLRGVVTISTWNSRERMRKGERKRERGCLLNNSRTWGMFYLTIGERDNEDFKRLGIQCRVNGQTVHRFCSATRSITSA